MRKIIESTLVSADGVIGDPPRWAMEYRDAEVTDEALERLASADAMLMGRGTYELFSAVWPGQSGEFAKQPLEFAGAKTFSTGVVVLTYRLAGQPG